jgi:hypothetical protein
LVLYDKVIAGVKPGKPFGSLGVIIVGGIWLAIYYVAMGAN